MSQYKWPKGLWVVLLAAECSIILGSPDRLYIIVSPALADKTYMTNRIWKRIERRNRNFKYLRSSSVGP